MNPARQIAVAIISATVLLLCSGPVAGRFGQHDGGKIVFLNHFVHVISLYRRIIVFSGKKLFFKLRFFPRKKNFNPSSDYGGKGTHRIQEYLFFVK